jgi:hypothetical protein
LHIISKAAWEEWKKKNAERQETGVVRPWDFINPATQFAPEEEQDRSYSNCSDSPHLTALKTCTHCGCFMPNKTKLFYADCPIGKW